MGKRAKRVEPDSAPERDYRAQHDPVEVVETRDPENWPVRLSRTVDTVGRLLKNGMLAENEAGAANRFRQDFHRGQLDPARAPDIGRIPTRGKRYGVSSRIEEARDAVWHAMQSLGGMRSPAGSCVWYIVGAGYTIREWSIQQSFGRGVSLRHEVATGILVGALGALQAHYDRERKIRS